MSIFALLGLFAGIVLGSIALVAISLVRSGTAISTLVYGLVFCASVAVVGIEDLIEQWARHLPDFAATVMAASLWPFTLSLFGYQASRIVLLIPTIVLGSVFLFGHVIAPGYHDQAQVVARALIMVTGLTVAIFVFKTDADDLDPVRRQIRRPFIALIGFWVASASVFGTLVYFDQIPQQLMLLDEVINAVMAFAGAVIFTTPRAGLFAPPDKPAERRTQSQSQPFDDEGLLARLDIQMREKEAWREEGLTVGKLAEILGVPEHRLRPLINQHLGYRNFATFVNSHRLAEAKRQLRAHEHASDNIATIAFACGFASLGPFGRAFKEDTGLTPTAYRKAHQNL